MVERALGRDALPPFPDDDGDLGLVIELLGFGRPEDRLAVPDQGVGHPQEDARKRGQRRIVVFLVPVGVVDADADGLFRPRDRPPIGDLVEAEIGRSTVRGGFRPAPCVLAEEVHQPGRFRHARPEVDHPGAVDDAEGLPPRGLEGQ